MLATSQVGDCWCLVIADSEVADAEWRGWLAEVERDTSMVVRVLLYIANGGPNAIQRAQLYRLAEQRKVRIAALADSAFGRGVVKAMSWSGQVVVQAHATKNIEAALNFLGLQSAHRAEALAALRSLLAEAGVGYEMRR